MGSVALGDSVLAIQATTRYLWVLWRGTGERAWRKRLNAPGATGPLLTPTRVFAASSGQNGTLYAYSLKDGDKIWSEQLGPIQGHLARHGEAVFAATESGWVHAHNLETGEPTWQRRLPGRIRGGVTVVGPRLVVATDDSLYMLATTDGALVTSTATGGAIVNAPAIQHETMVVTSPDGFLAFLEVESLREQWRLEIDAPVFGSPAIARDTVFAISVDGALWTVPLAAPQAARHIRLGAAIRASPAPLARGILVGTLAGEVRWYNPYAREPRVRLQMAGPLEQPPLVSRGDMVIADGRGVVQLWH